MDKSNASASARMQAKIMSQLMIDPSMGMKKLPKKKADAMGEAGPVVEGKRTGGVGDDKRRDAAPGNVTEPSLGAVVNKKLAELRIKANSSKAADNLVPAMTGDQVAGMHESSAPIAKQNQDATYAKAPMPSGSLDKAGEAKTANPKGYAVEQATENEYDFIDESEVIECFEEINENEAREKYVLVELTPARNVATRRGRGSSRSG